MLKLYLALVILVVSACAESVRETETWIKPTNDVNNDLVSSGDFEFSHEDETLIDDLDDDDDDDDEETSDDYEEMSGSGDDSIFDDVPKNPEEIDNRISDIEPKPKDTARPLDQDIIAVSNNEIAYQPSIHLSQAGEQNIFNKKEVLAAVIAGGAVGLLFAVLLVLLLVYRMKKKDEGSYELGKKPIYKKAPTAEIYA